MLTCLYVVNRKLYAEKVNMTGSNTIVGTSTYCTTSSSAPFSASHQISFLSRTCYLCLASKTALSGLQQERLSQQATPTNSANPPMAEQTERSRGRSCAVCGCPHTILIWQNCICITLSSMQEVSSTILAPAIWKVMEASCVDVHWTG